MKHPLTFAAISLLTPCSFAQWTEVCTEGDGFVVNFEAHGNVLYATGFFSELCDSSVNYVARRTGDGWENVGNFSEAGHFLRSIDNELYAVRYEPDTDSNWLYMLNNGTFEPVGSGIYLTTASGLSNTPNLYNVIKYNNEIVISGEFDRVGSQSISGIARWNGIQWQELGTGLSGNIPSTAPIMYPHDLCLFGDDLIAAGNFGSAGGETVNGIARWDGSQWHALGQGFNGTVYGIAVFDGQLYAGGDFTASGSTQLDHLAKWNGSEWVHPGFGVKYNNSMYYSYVHTLKVWNNKLYFSRGFDRVLENSVTRLGSAIAAFDGAAIDTLHGGLPGQEIEAIALYEGAIHAGGGLNGSSFIARYDYFTGISESNESTVWNIDISDGNIQLELLVPFETIELYTTSGQLVATIDRPDSNLSFNSVGTGIYFIKGITNGSSLLQKVIFPF